MPAVQFRVVESRRGAGLAGDPALFCFAGALVEIRVSNDIRAVIDWEIANNANSVENVYYPQGLPVVAMKRPVKRWLGGVLHDVPPTLRWWESRDAHYGRRDWCAGFESSESGHKVCGPLR